MNVYLLIEGEYESAVVIGVYSSLERAQAQLPGATWATAPGPWWASPEVWTLGPFAIHGPFKLDAPRPDES